jgi:hypothetical protein
MIMHMRGTAALGSTHLATGDRVRVASGVFGSPGHIRSMSPGHILVQYDRGGREVIDPTRRPVWVIGSVADTPPTNRHD